MRVSFVWFLFTWTAHGTSGMFRDIIPARLNYNWLGRRCMKIIEEIERLRSQVADLRRSASNPKPEE